MIILDNSKIIDKAIALLSGGCESCHYNILSSDIMNLSHMIYILSVDMKENFCSNIDNVKENDLYKRKKKK